MPRNEQEQEDLCLQTKFLIDKLRTNLIMIEDFKDSNSWDKKLRSLKSDIINIYWNL